MSKGIPKPFHRTVRQLSDGSYAGSGNGRYVRHPDYATDAHLYMRSYLLIQKDLLELFDYVDPSDRNLTTYSHRINALLMRACVEVEANCKAVLRDNGYGAGTGRWNMGDYKKIEASHRMSGYKVLIPGWHGVRNIRRPFEPWSAAPSGALPWYEAYHATKHDRHAEFERASLENLTDAVCGLVALLWAQFRDEGGGPDVLVAESPADDFESSIGEFFRVLPPDDWDRALRYDFDWHNTLSKERVPFQQFDYSQVP